MGAVSTQSPGAGMSMHGVVDLAALAAAREAQAKAEERRATNPPGAPTAWSIDVTEETFQADVIDQSFVVPVVIDLWATWCEPCKQLSPVLEALTTEYAGRFLLAKVDVDANPRISQAFQVQSIPSVVAVIKGQPVPLFQGALPEPAVRQYLDELLKVAEANGLAADEAAPADEPGEEPAGDPRFDAAFDAVERGDWDAAEAAYQAVLAESPADAEAQAGLGQVGSAPAHRRRGPGRGPGGRRRRAGLGAGADARRRRRAAHRPRGPGLRPDGRAGPAHGGRRAQRGPRPPRGAVRPGGRRRPPRRQGPYRAGQRPVLTPPPSRRHCPDRRIRAPKRRQSDHQHSYVGSGGGAGRSQRAPSGGYAQGRGRRLAVPGLVRRRRRRPGCRRRDPPYALRVGVDDLVPACRRAAAPMR